MSLPYRILVAVLFAVFAIAILPPFSMLVGFPLTGPLWEVIRLCIGGIAVFYALTGRPSF